ncbi:hypothetical protein RF11_07915 [Thelohanellus kitauei]|uniref:Uncharacterized protein n=1 Tax=Thelohanellus kitauei TaxID=669202 RepID=A0A0C2MFT5_THEKT|nr:hypothetical protein RF11_07915 [Thelohanellus kitauei]
MFLDNESIPPKSIGIHVQKATVDKLLLWDYRDIYSKMNFGVRMFFPIIPDHKFPVRNIHEERNGKYQLNAVLYGYRMEKADIMERWRYLTAFGLRIRPVEHRLKSDDPPEPVISYDTKEFLSDVAVDILKPKPLSFKGVSFIHGGYCL